MRLFCFPYAGGAAGIFRLWSEILPATIEICPVQLPGRGSRLREPPYTDLLSLVRVAAQELLPYMGRPFALFGHSMGATISFELARLLRYEHHLEPVHLFVSSRPAPQLGQVRPSIYDLPDDQFLEELRTLKGTPGEVLENPELMQLILPLLRADFQMIQTYTYLPRPPLDCPITVFGGLQDTYVKCEHLEAWREQTSGRFSLCMFDGDHFFLHMEQQRVLETLAQELNQHVQELRRASYL